MKQHKVILIALVIICITAILAALVMRKDLCEVHIRTGEAEVAVFTACESA
ncbi:type I toxin-antitoxin system Hok family toxin [Enterobacteriaceae bacterium G50]|nr:type I toxin-antitoxin system Hok family toxin [Enterobacteriaceae bacterium G50]